MMNQHILTDDEVKRRLIKNTPNQHVKNWRVYTCKKNIIDWQEKYKKIPIKNIP